MDPLLSGSLTVSEDPLDWLGIYQPPDAAHKDCVTCEGHFPSVETQQQCGIPCKMELGNIAAQALLSDRLSDTRKNLQRVRNMLRSHGDLILARWKKYTPKRRAELLDKASALFAVPSRKFLDGLDASEDHANVYVSWLDIAEFSEDRMRLMSLLHVRSEYGPEQWAAFDTRSSWLACQQDGWLRCAYNVNAVVMHGEHYGKLVPFDVSRAHSWQEVGFPRAELTFWVQEGVSAALSAVVDLIVDGEKPRGNVKWTMFLSKGLRGAYEEALWGSYYHQEFTPPSQFDPEVISEKTGDHLNMLMDDMELTQTDPKYMCQYALELKKDIFVSEKEKKIGGEWTKATGAIAFRRMSDLMRWRQVVREADKLRKALVDYRSKRLSEACLDRDADTAVSNFGVMISGMLRTLVQEEGTPMLETIAIMRSRWLQEEECRKLMPDAHIRELCDCVDSHNQCDRIKRIVKSMESSLVHESPDGISWLLLKMRHEMRGVTYNKDVENWLSGMALLDEIHTLWRWRQTHCHHGSETAVTPILEFSGTPPKNSRSSCRQTPADAGRLQESSESLRTLCEIFPKNALRGSSSPKQMMEAHDRLTKFWQCARKAWNLGQMEDGNSDVSKSDLLSLMSFDVSPEYLDTVEAVRLRSEIEECQEARRQDETHFVQQPWDTRSGEDGAVRRNLPKKSNASRNDASAEDEDRLQMMELGQALVNDVDTADLKSQVEVTKETLDVIAQLFPVEARDTGMVRWAHFVHALADAGMAATQSAGSAVTFKVLDQSTSFHKPHPEPEIDAIKARSFGKRLSKKYGWKNETFVLRKKVPAEVQGDALE
jgi:hypothetical protein